MHLAVFCSGVLVLLRVLNVVGTGSHVLVDIWGDCYDRLKANFRPPSPQLARAGRTILFLGCRKFPEAD